MILYKHVYILALCTYIDTCMHFFYVCLLYVCVCLSSHINLLALSLCIAESHNFSNFFVFKLCAVQTLYFKTLGINFGVSVFEDFCVSIASDGVNQVHVSLH